MPGIRRLRQRDRLRQRPKPEAKCKGHDAVSCRVAAKRAPRVDQGEGIGWLGCAARSALECGGLTPPSREAWRSAPKEKKQMAAPYPYAAVNQIPSHFQ